MISRSCGMFCMLDRENNAVAPSFQQFHRPIQGVMARIVPLNSPERIPSNISFEDRYKDLVFSHLGDQSFSQHLLQTLFDLNPRNSTNRILSHNKEVDRPLLQHDFFKTISALVGRPTQNLSGDVLYRKCRWRFALATSTFPFRILSQSLKMAKLGVVM